MSAGIERGIAACLAAVATSTRECCPLIRPVVVMQTRAVLCIFYRTLLYRQLHRPSNDQFLKAPRRCYFCLVIALLCAALQLKNASDVPEPLKTSNTSPSTVSIRKVAFLPGRQRTCALRPPICQVQGKWGASTISVCCGAEDLWRLLFCVLRVQGWKIMPFTGPAASARQTCSHIVRTRAYASRAVLTTGSEHYTRFKLWLPRVHQSRE